MADVARRAGVSQATVSRALSQAGVVKAQTLEKIERAIHELGYQRNPMVQALMGQVRRQRVQRLTNIAWFEQVDLKHTDRSVDRNRRLREASQFRAESLGYGFEVIYQPGSELSADRLDGIFKARGVQGVVLAPLRNLEMKYIFPWENYAMATIGRSLDIKLNYVMMHFQHAMELVLRKLTDRGCRRIAFMLSKYGNTRSEHIPLMSFLHFNHFRDSQYQIEPLWEDDLTPAALNQWFQLNRPEVIIGHYTHSYHRLRECGLNIPEDVSFVSVSSHADSPEVSGVHVPVQALGAGAVDLVVAQIQRNERGLRASPKNLLIEGEWWEGGTLTF
jgi:DNA-binding LacI/PurR family transcriptional regulator